MASHYFVQTKFKIADAKGTVFGTLTSSLCHVLPGADYIAIDFHTLFAVVGGRGGMINLRLLLFDLRCYMRCTLFQAAELHG